MLHQRFAFNKIRVLHSVQKAEALAAADKSMLLAKIVLRILESLSSRSTRVLLALDFPF